MACPPLPTCPENHPEYPPPAAWPLLVYVGHSRYISPSPVLTFDTSFAEFFSLRHSLHPVPASILPALHYPPSSPTKQLPSLHWLLPLIHPLTSRHLLHHRRPLGLAHTLSFHPEASIAVPSPPADLPNSFLYRAQNQQASPILYSYHR